MKITPDDIGYAKRKPIELFFEGIKSEETTKKYKGILRRILCEYLDERFVQGSFEERANQFVEHAKEKPEWATDILLVLSKNLKERTKLHVSDKNYLNPNTVPNYFKPVRKLLDMSGVPVAWRRISATYPESNNNHGGRGYTVEEIQKMTKFAKGALDKALILVAASSGIREGGFLLKWEDLKPVYKIEDKLSLEKPENKNAEIVCAILHVYQKSNEAYVACITLEAYNAILDYKKIWVKESRREPTPDDPLFKRAGPKMLPLTPSGIKQRIYRVIENAGMKPPHIQGKRRLEIPVMNGFRRTFNKTLKESCSGNLDSLTMVEMLLGHHGIVSLDKNYFKAKQVEIAKLYLNAAPNLTISNETRLLIKNVQLTKEKQENEEKYLQEMKSQYVELRKEMKVFHDFIPVEIEQDPNKRAEKMKRFTEKYASKYDLDPNKPAYVDISVPPESEKAIREIFQ